jgi:hypothetical protein
MERSVRTPSKIDGRNPFEDPAHLLKWVRKMTRSKMLIVIAA